MSILERAIFVWYLYANAFLINLAISRVPSLVIRNEAFGPATARQLSEFLNMPAFDDGKILKTYHALAAPDFNVLSLGKDGQSLWEKVRHVDKLLMERATAA